MKLDEIDKQVTQSDITNLEKFADRLFAKVGIDVEFTRHFLDRVNDERNRKQITMGELTRLFKQEFKKWGKPIAQMGPDQEAVMKDMVTNINMPFALRWDHKNNELDLIAKTVMRKKDFKTSNKEFPVESKLEEDTLSPGEIVALATAASVTLPVMKAFIKGVYRTGKGYLKLKRLANKAGVKLANTVFNEGYKLQLERDTDMMVLNITDTATGKRTEVRGKAGYESGNYDADDKLHQLLDRIGKASNISDLMNGEVVGINPKHPDGKNAKAHADKAFNEEKLETASIITPSIKALDKIFKQNKFEIRIVGGAVRDIALGKEPKDIDFATDATPDEMQKMFDKAGIRHIPTGIEHGTITAVIDGEDFEITTLRADKETDGRHADVEFVRSWEEDAKRRDLTYNAMSMDIDGEIYDYHNGMDDLQDKVSKFVGDPEQRITEDYLRILRYFRFQGRLDTPTWDNDTLNAIKKHANGLSKISAERIWMEMSKILSGKNVANVLSAMQKTGVSKVIGLSTDNAKEVKDDSNPIVTLSHLGNNTDIAKRWKMKKTDAILLDFLNKNKTNKLDQKKVKDMIADGIDKELISALAQLQGVSIDMKDTDVPEFPVTGNDLIAKGMKRGPELGMKLNQLKTKWKQSNFTATKDELLKEKITKRTPMGKVVDDFYKSDAPQFKGKSKAKRRQMAIAAKLSTLESALHELKEKYDQLKGTHKFTKSAKPGGKESPHPARGLLVGNKISEDWLLEVTENFADGKVKGKSRPGRVKRAGASCKGSVTELRAKAKKASGEKAKMYHWCANMKSGKKK